MAPLMYLSVFDNSPRDLLLCGVPLPQGQVEAGSGFVLQDEDRDPLLLWWAERAYWADGSVKWIFIHARLKGDEQRLSLHADRADCPGLALTADGVDVDGARLQCTDMGWRFSVGRESVEIQFGTMRASGVQASTAPFALSLLEASPIAPLVRWRQESGAGVYTDNTMRLDAARGQIYWQQRLSFAHEGVCQLEELGAAAQFSGGGEGWHFAAGAQEHLQVLRPGRFSLDGASEQEGHPLALVTRGACSLVLEKAWQRAPFSLAAAGARVDIGFYPQEADALPVHSGTSFRHAVRLGLQGVNASLVGWSLDAEMACASGAFGPLMAQNERTRRLFPGYEQAMRAGLDGARLSRLDKERGQETGPAAALQDEAGQDEEYFGLQHYGDWPMALGAYKGERRMYADNEYDTPYAFFLQFVRSGQVAYLEVAYHAAVHMADIDCQCTDGDMHYHGYYERAEDHGAHRSLGGDLGHYWTDGLALNYLLCGDWWSWQAAQAQGRYLLGVFAGAGDEAIRRHFLGCERTVGWPLTALCGVAEVAADGAIMGKMAQMVGFLARFSADPDREVEEITDIGGEPLQWWRIGLEDGSKPFMLGVVLEGLERYHRLTQDPAAAEAAVNISRFLVEVMWVEGIEAFIYEWNAFNRSHREDVYPHYINMMVAPGLAFAYELTGEERFRQVATRAFHAALWTLFAPGGGKEIGMVGRTSALMVGRLHEWKQRQDSRRDEGLSASNGVAFSFSGSAQGLEEVLARRRGEPTYREGALYSAGDSFAVYGFKEPAASEKGEIAFSFVPEWDCPPHPGPVAQRAYVHLSDRPFTRSCVSVISFYTGLHVRFYDADRHYIEVLEADIQAWRKGVPVQVRLVWEALGEAVLWIDGQERDRRTLGRRISGAFKRLHLGHRPGNWRADGWIDDVVLSLG
ncbi:MAG: hypothetical protein GKR89_34565 [Candidatus Latescibacteria bacterium]|nr:hypothetical protein [Candidatus Latescibacterota bacterium]